MISQKASGEVLGLRFDRDRDRLACVLQPLVEKLLLLIREKADTPDSSRERTQLRQQLEALTRLLLDSESRRKAVELTAPIVELCAKLLETAPKTANHTEILAAIALVREAVESIDGVEGALQRSLADSATRFDALLGVDNLQQLKIGLAQQVQSLRDVASKREQQWRRQMASVDRKIKTLETQLAETRLEARHDALTGLVNRRSVESSFKLFQESRRPFVLALFDVDDFKKINDTHGHLAGDSSLKAIASRLQASVRSHDVVGRFGGDEFIVMMVDVSLSLAERRLLSVLQVLRTMAPVVEGATKLTVTCGVSEFTSGDTFETLVARADAALYDAKRAGKNRLGIKSMPYIRNTPTPR